MKSSPLHSMFQISILIVMFGLSACVSLLVSEVEEQLIKLKPGQYSLDKTHASLLFKVKHMGLSTFVGRFNNFDASLDFQADVIEDSKLNAVIEMSSLDVNNPSLKSDLERAKWLSTTKYPQASFKTISVVQRSGGILEFTGELNWRGVTKLVPMKVSFHGGANNILTGKYTLGFSATTKFKRSDFGMDAYIPLVGDEILIEAEAEFQRQ